MVDIDKHNRFMHTFEDYADGGGALYLYDE